MCSDFHVISSVAHGWFTNALFNIQSLGILLVIFLFLLLVFNFQVNCIFVRTYFLWFHFQILWNLLGLALWSSMWWPILLNVLCTLEKNEFCSCLSAAFVCVCVCVCVCGRVNRLKTRSLLEKKTVSWLEKIVFSWLIINVSLEEVPYRYCHLIYSLFLVSYSIDLSIS